MTVNFFDRYYLATNSEDIATIRDAAIYDAFDNPAGCPEHPYLPRCNLYSCVTFAGQMACVPFYASSLKNILSVLRGTILGVLTCSSIDRLCCSTRETSDLNARINAVRHRFLATPQRFQQLLAAPDTDFILDLTTARSE